MNPEIEKLIIEFAKYIKDEELMAVLIYLLEHTPESNFIRATSSSGKYHLEDENLEWGNLLHTQRVTRTAVKLADIKSLSESEVELLVVASILHDSYKYGKIGTEAWTQKFHPYIAAEEIRKLLEEFKYKSETTQSKIEDILVMIEEHMGKWSPKPLEVSHYLGEILHIADALEAGLDSIL